MASDARNGPNRIASGLEQMAAVAMSWTGFAGLVLQRPAVDRGAKPACMWIWSSRECTSRAPPAYSIYAEHCRKSSFEYCKVFY